MEPNKTIRWKVVTLRNRSLYTLSKYNLEYKENKITKAPPNTLGIFCCKTENDAEEFHLSCAHWTKIIKVKTYGEGIKIQRVCGSFDVNRMDEWYRNPQMYDPVSEGTICYPAVMPLE